MKKALIMTWYKNYNYGTALQACSLKKVLENPKLTGLKNAENVDFELECYFLPHIPKKKLYLKRKIKKIFSVSAYKEKFRQYQDKKIYESKKELFDIRNAAYDKFLENNIKLASDHFIQSSEELERMGTIFDFYIAGSDQIWNPEALDETYLLEWVNDEKVRLSYASSLSVQELPRKNEKLYAKALKKFKSISIRDTKCQEQLSKIVGKNVETVADPVVLLGPEELVKNCFSVEIKNYAFSYFLGDSLENRKYFYDFAILNKLNLKSIIGITNGNLKNDEILEPYADWNADPWKFVSYIYNSDFVVTDSFHATVISVLLHKNFVVLEKDRTRPEQNNRIKEFLKLVGLENRWKFMPKDFKEAVIDEASWKVADEAITKSRENSFEYLKKAILD